MEPTHGTSAEAFGPVGLFRLADKDSDGVLTREEGLGLLAHCGLPDDALEEILEMTSDDGNMTVSQWTVALRLVAMHQARSDTTSSCEGQAARASSMPLFDGLDSFLCGRCTNSAECDLSPSASTSSPGCETGAALGPQASTTDISSLGPSSSVTASNPDSSATPSEHDGGGGDNDGGSSTSRGSTPAPSSRPAGLVQSAAASLMRSSSGGAGPSGTTPHATPVPVASPVRPGMVAQRVAECNRRDSLSSQGSFGSQPAQLQQRPTSARSFRSASSGAGGADADAVAAVGAKGKALQAGSSSVSSSVARQLCADADMALAMELQDAEEFAAAHQPMTMQMRAMAPAQALQRRAPPDSARAKSSFSRLGRFLRKAVM